MSNVTAPASHPAARGAIIAAVMVAVMLALVLGGPVAHARANTTSAPLTALNLTLVYEDAVTNPKLGVTARIADDVPLPAEVALPAPPSAEVLWSGEYFLDGQQEDIFVEGRREIRDGIPVVVFPLATSRVAHLELMDPSFARLVDASQAIKQLGFEVALPAVSGQVDSAIVLPSQVSIVDGPEGLQSVTREDGSSEHSLSSPSAQPGDFAALEMMVQDQTAVPDEAGANVWPLALVIAVIVGVVSFFTVRSRKRAGSASK